MSDHLSIEIVGRCVELRTARLPSAQRSSGPSEAGAFATRSSELKSRSRMAPRRRSPPLRRLGRHRAPRTPRLARGLLLVSATLRTRNKARHHLPHLAAALHLIPPPQRRSADAGLRLASSLEAVAAMAEAGAKDHYRWLTARQLLERKLDGQRRNSKLGALIELGLRELTDAGDIVPGASCDRSLCAWIYSHPRSPNAVRSTPGGAYHPPAR
jgi:hypothetical protein